MANEKIKEVWLTNGESNDYMPSGCYYSVSRIADVLKDTEGNYIFNEIEEGSPWCSFISQDNNDVVPFFSGKLPTANSDYIHLGGGILDNNSITTRNYATFFGMVASGRRQYDIYDRIDNAFNIYKSGEGVTDTSNWYPYQRSEMHPLTTFDYSKIVVGYSAVLYNPTNGNKISITNNAQWEQFKNDYPVVIQIDFRCYYDGTRFNGSPYVVIDNSYNGNRTIGGHILNRIYPYFRSSKTLVDAYVTLAPNNICVNDNYTEDFGNILLVDLSSNWFGSFDDTTYHFNTLGTEHYAEMNKMIHGLRSEYLKAYVNQIGYKTLLCDLSSYLPQGYESSEGFGLNKVEENGENRGETYTGSDTQTLPNYNASDIVPNIDIFIDTNNYVDRINLPDISITLRSYFSNFFAVSDINLTGAGALISKLFPLTESDRDELKAGTVAYGSNPIDAVRSFRVYPLDLDYVFQNAFEEGEIHLGSYNTGVVASKLKDLKQCVLDVGSFVIPPKYNDWRDTDQYVKVSIYLPYIGSTEISYQQNIKKRINIKYIIDITSGVCEAIITSDGLVISQGLSGQIGFDMSIAGDNVVSYSNIQRQGKQMELQRSQQRFNNVIGIAQGVRSLSQGIKGNIANALSGGAVGGLTDTTSQAIGLVNDVGNAIYSDKSATMDIEWNNQMAESLAPISAGVSGSMADLLGIQNIIVTFIYSKFEYPELLDKRSGGVTYMSKKLGECTGFIKTKDATLNWGNNYPSDSFLCVPTAHEMDALRNLLNNGIYMR